MKVREERLYGPFVLKKRKWDKQKLRKSINEFGLTFNLNLFIDFHNTLT
jgi:hypothetical protein